MRLSDVISENQLLSELEVGSAAGQSSELPQNFLGRVKTGVQKYLHPNANVRARAAGISDVANMANRYMASYQQWVGKTYPEEGTTVENLKAWLTKEGLPITGRVASILSNVNKASERVEPTLEDEGASTPIDNTVVSQVITAAVKEKNVGNGVTARSSVTKVPTTSSPTNTVPTTSSPTNTVPTTSSPTNTVPTAVAPKIDIQSIASFYKQNPNSRKELRDQLNKIDAEQAEIDADHARHASGVGEGYSRYLGMSL